MPNPENKNKAFFVRSEHKNLLEYVNENCSPLLGSDIFFDTNGELFYVSYHDLPKQRALPEQFIQISNSSKRGNIYAQESQVASFKETRVNHIKGGVEDAIRAMDYILEKVIIHKKVQIQEMGKHAHSLLDLFSSDFLSITQKEFNQKRAETEALLDRVNLNPGGVIDSEIKRISHWLLKASSGKDSLGRQNKLISTMALSAAYRHAIEKHKGIGPTTQKYARMREALIFEREFTREMLTDIASWVRPTMIPAHEMFRHPFKKSKNEYFVVGKLNSILYQISWFHVNPYKQEGQGLTEKIKKILGFIKEQKNSEIDRYELFQNLYHDVLKSLNKHKDIYPDTDSNQ